MCLTGIESRSPGSSSLMNGDVGLLGDDVDLPADEAQALVREQRARQQPGLAQHLEAVADPQHGPALGCERRHRLHRRREARDRARAQVVAVAEAARDDDPVEAARSVSSCQTSRASPTRSQARDGVALVAAARELEDADQRLRPVLASASSSTTSKSSISGLASSFSQSASSWAGSSVSSSTRRPTRTFGDALEPQRGQRPLHRLPLGIEDALLRPDQHLGLHELRLATGPGAARACAR